MKFLFLLLSLLSSMQLYAKFDLKYGVQGRSFPSPGGEAYVESGYNYSFWGDTKTPLFGLIRPSAQVRSNLFINTIGAQISIYPISFIGLDYGLTNIYSNYDKFIFYDCETTRCEGEIHRNYSAAKIALGYKNFLAVSRMEYNQNKYNDPTGKGQQVVEFLFGTLAAPRNDNHTFSQSFIGYKFKDDLIGIAYEYVDFEKSNMQYLSTFLVYSMKVNDQNYTFGLGTLETDHWGKGIVFNFAWSKTILKSLKLF